LISFSFVEFNPLLQHHSTLRNSFCAPGYAVILGVEANRAVRQAGGSRTMLDRTAECLCLKPPRRPNTPAQKIQRDLGEDARDVARAFANTPAYEHSRHRRERVLMLFAQLERILRPGRLRLRGPCDARDEFLLAATAQNLGKLAKLRPMTVLA
jgi:hypothetical protein